MRPILHGDLVAAARVLLLVSDGEREGRVRAMLSAAEMGDCHRKRTGRAHPRFGGGSLMAATAAWPKAAEPGPGDPDYLRCLRLVIVALLDRRG